jgi:hypothetical protein
VRQQDDETRSSGWPSGGVFEGFNLDADRDDDAKNSLLVATPCLIVWCPSLPATYR